MRLSQLDPPAEHQHPAQLMRSQIISECEVMVKYALASGMQVPPAVLENIGEAGADHSRKVADGTTPTQWRRLAQAHDQLCRLVTPATPRTLLLLHQERGRSRMSMLGPIALIRKLVLVSIFLLIVFLLSALSPDVNSVNGDVFTSSGMNLLVNEVFLLAAAGIGAAFAALFTASRYIARRTYDPQYESTYWIRFVLGLLAGIVLASLIPVKTDSTIGAFSRPLLALIGGFSAAVVFRILTRLVATLESLFQGDPHTSTDAIRERLLAEVKQRTSQDQLRLGTALVRIREQLASGATYDTVMGTVSRILDDLVPVDPRDTSEPPATPPERNPPASDPPAQTAGEPDPGGQAGNPVSRDSGSEGSGG